MTISTANGADDERPDDLYLDIDKIAAALRAVPSRRNPWKTTRCPPDLALIEDHLCALRRQIALLDKEQVGKLLDGLAALSVSVVQHRAEVVSAQADLRSNLAELRADVLTLRDELRGSSWMARVARWLWGHRFNILILASWSAFCAALVLFRWVALMQTGK